MGSKLIPPSQAQPMVAWPPQSRVPTPPWPTYPMILERLCAYMRSKKNEESAVQGRRYRPGPEHGQEPGDRIMLRRDEVAKHGVYK